MKHYSRDHEWVLLEGEKAVIGISAYAAEELGDITYVELPEIGTDLIVGDQIGVVESVKAASDILSPVSGSVSELNENLNDNPGLINSSPEGEGWICKLENIDHLIDEINDLMDEKAYKKYLKTIAKGK